MSERRGGEPLSEELETKLTMVLDALALHDTHGIIKRSGILRAFAREIQESHSGAKVLMNTIRHLREERIKPLESALLASQSREKALREALRDVIEWQGITHFEGCPEDDTCECPLVEKVNSALSAYPCGRSSEVKPTDVRSVDSPITDTEK